MKISEFLRILDPLSSVDVHLVVTRFPSRFGQVFLLDRDFLQRLKKVHGWSKQFPYVASVSRIYARDGSITLTARFDER